MKGFCCVAFCFFFIFSVAPVCVQAQDRGLEDPLLGEEVYFAAGVVEQVTSSQIVISEYDFDAGQEVKATYLINSDTKVEGVEKISDFQSGDDVEIEYLLTGDQKIALVIEKYVEDLSDEEAVFDTYDRDAEVTADRMSAENAAIEMGEPLLPIR